MIQVKYKGYIPEGYSDSGNAINTIYIDNTKYPNIDKVLIEKIAKHDCRQCNDCFYRCIVEIKYNYTSKIPGLCMVYNGYSSKYDKYFKKVFTTFKSYCSKL